MVLLSSCLGQADYCVYLQTVRLLYVSCSHGRSSHFDKNLSWYSLFLIAPSHTGSQPLSFLISCFYVEVGIFLHGYGAVLYSGGKYYCQTPYERFIYCISPQSLACSWVLLFAYYRKHAQLTFRTHRFARTGTDNELLVEPEFPPEPDQARTQSTTTLPTRQTASH